MFQKGGQNSPRSSGSEQPIRLREDEQPESGKDGKKKLSRFAGKHVSKKGKRSSRRK
jgi:hypothetical protein